MILVTGATGELGQLVVEALLKRVAASEIAVAVRNPAKAGKFRDLGIDIRVADYDKPETWTSALRGIDKVLLISANEVGRRLAQHKTVIEAAKAEGVKFIAYTSLLHADRSPLELAEEHRATEALIEESKIPYVILRNGWYLENYAGVLQNALSQGALYGAAKEGRISAASRADFAEAAAVVLSTKGPLKKVYELAGDKGFTLSELASLLSSRGNKTVRYTNLSESEYKAALVGVGLPEGFAHILADADTGISKGALHDESGDLRALIQRDTESLNRFVERILPH